MRMFYTKAMSHPLLLYCNASADPRGHSWSRFFHFDIQIFTKCSRIRICPPPSRLAPLYEKSCIQHCNVNPIKTNPSLSTFNQMISSETFSWLDVFYHVICKSVYVTGCPVICITDTELCTRFVCHKWLCFDVTKITLNDVILTCMCEIMNVTWELELASTLNNRLQASALPVRKSFSMPGVNWPS